MFSVVEAFRENPQQSQYEQYADERRHVCNRFEDRYEQQAADAEAEDGVAFAC